MEKCERCGSTDGGDYVYYYHSNTRIVLCEECMKLWKCQTVGNLNGEVGGTFGGNSYWTSASDEENEE